LKAASAFFMAEPDRPHDCSFIREHEGRRNAGGLRWGVKSIGAALAELG
jgi:hypothetical protein